MSDKVYKITLTVDLQCQKCKKIIKKTLCKLRERNEKIRSVMYDYEKNTVTISGPFEAQKLSKKICCKAREVIKEIKIEEVKPPPPPPPPPPPSPPPTLPCRCRCRCPRPGPVWCKAYCGDCRCCSCGCVFASDGSCYDWPMTCQFNCEEPPATCAIM